MLNLPRIGQKIVQRRTEMNISQKELAQQLFVTHQAVSKWENGKSIPSIEILVELTNILQISIDYLLEDSETLSYQDILQQSGCEAMLFTFFQSEKQDQDIENIFYLLDGQNRQLILEKIIHNQLNLDIRDVWHLLSKKERLYLIGVITSNKYDYDLSHLHSQLSVTEIAMIDNQCKHGNYKYSLRKFKGVIR